MDILDEPTKMMFFDVIPEDIYKYILNKKGDKCVSHEIISGNQREAEIFSHAASHLRKTYSEEEISLIKANGRDMCLGNKEDGHISVFHLLPEFSKNIITFRKGEPLCDKSHMLRWREMSFFLGQDILTTAHRAMDDCRNDRETKFFAWPYTIHMNNCIVSEVVEKGLSENHSHLNGAVPPFEISWICLMNHLSDIKTIWSEKSKASSGYNFGDFLNPRPLYNADEEKWSVSEMIILAAWLRVNLFMRLSGIRNHDEHGEVQSESLLKEYEYNRGTIKWLDSHIEILRICRGLYVPQIDGSVRNLDYAYPGELCDSRNAGFFRLFVGERHLLYGSFLDIFRGEMQQGYQDLFYLYLLLKIRVRSELVQVNGNVGFYNFMRYENRKGLLWDFRKEYVAEGRRITLNGKQADQHIVSQEERLVPRETKKAIKQYIDSIDYEVVFRDYNEDIEKLLNLRAGNGNANNNGLYSETQKLINYYVMHFIKQPVEDKDNVGNWLGECRPRNYTARINAKKRAIALAEALVSYPHLRNRIRGIDACNREIWCRPETFATEIRFLRGLQIDDLNASITDEAESTWGGLRCTYHVGEDYLDIADGLRAIDEAIEFLEMRRGERIGHALALGVYPRDHYGLKKYRVMTRKQDRLDDLVWLLFRSREYNVRIPSYMRAEMRDNAESLMHELYGSFIKNDNFTLNDYYNAMKLRGDHPDMYTEYDSKESKGAKLQELFCGFRYSVYGQYVSYYSLRKSKESDMPKRSELDKFMYHYHFDCDVRENGLKTCSFAIDDDYISLINDMQEAMIGDLTDKGIYVECNPSSNVLIGTFGKYERHPIFRFNQYRMNKKTNNHLCASLNTDDMGIFDTSLENEYAYVAAALESMRDDDGKRLYDDDFILEYLDHLRLMGERQVFRL